jgi:hypothetical protein
MLYSIFIQCFNFPLSVTYQNCFVLIHLHTTHTQNYFSPCTSASPCQYNSTIASYTFKHLPPMLYNIFSQYFSFLSQYHSTIAPQSFIHLPLFLNSIFLSAVHFSTLSIIQPLLHTHSTICHTSFFGFYSQCFNFHMSVSLNHCSTLIQTSHTRAV